MSVSRESDGLSHRLEPPRRRHRFWGSSSPVLAVQGFGTSPTRSAAPIREESGAPTIVGERACRAQWIGRSGALSSARYRASSPPTSPVTARLRAPEGLRLSAVGERHRAGDGRQRAASFSGVVLGCPKRRPDRPVGRSAAHQSLTIGDTKRVGGGVVAGRVDPLAMATFGGQTVTATCRVRDWA